jgi:hypothetical protein
MVGSRIVHGTGKASLSIAILSGFVVRESQGGRSTVGFDYRVVATPLGQTGRRIALADGAAGPRDPIPAVPSVRFPSPMKPVVP